MTWEAIIVAVSLVGMHAAWGVAYWCWRRLTEANETCRDKLWDVEQQRDQARVQRDEAIARADKRVAAAIKRAERAEQDNRRLRALRTRIAKVLAEHDHPGTVEVVVNTMCKGAGDDD